VSKQIKRRSVELCCHLLDRHHLVPQDPSDEPASVLLERIRAARATLPETSGKRGRKASSDFDASLLMAAEPVAPRSGEGRRNDTCSNEHFYIFGWSCASPH